MNNLLIKFDRNNGIANQADLGEKISNFSLGFLRIGFGKTVKVNSSENGVSFEERYYSTRARVAAVALAILIFPVTVLLAGIGCIGLYFSSSHQDISKLYSKNKEESHSEETVDLSIKTLDLSLFNEDPNEISSFVYDITIDANKIKEFNQLKYLYCEIYKKEVCCYLKSSPGVIDCSLNFKRLNGNKIWSLVDSNDNTFSVLMRDDGKLFAQVKNYQEILEIMISTL